MLGYGTLSRRLKTIRKDIRRHVVLDFCRFLNVILLNINTYTGKDTVDRGHDRKMSHKLRTGFIVATDLLK